MQYRSPNTTLDSCCQTLCIVTSRCCTSPTLFTIRLNGAPACFLLLSCSLFRYADKRIVNNNGSVYRKEQVATRINTIQ